MENDREGQDLSEIMTLKWELLEVEELASSRQRHQIPGNEKRVCKNPKVEKNGSLHDLKNHQWNWSIVKERKSWQWVGKAYMTLHAGHSKDFGFFSPKYNRKNIKGSQQENYLSTFVFKKITFPDKWRTEWIIFGIKHIPELFLFFARNNFII